MGQKRKTYRLYLNKNLKYKIYPEKIIIQYNNRLFKMSGNQLNNIKSLFNLFEHNDYSIAYDKLKGYSDIVNTFIDRGWIIKHNMLIGKSLNDFESQTLMEMGITDFSPNIYNSKKVSLVILDEKSFYVENKLVNFGFKNINILSTVKCPDNINLDSNTTVNLFSINQIDNINRVIYDSDFIISFNSSNNVFINEVLNNISIKNNIPIIFASVEGIMGRVGPLVIPKKTACYHCYLTRNRSASINSNYEIDLDDWDNEKHKIYRIESVLMSTLNISMDVIADQVKEFLLSDKTWALPDSVEGIIDINGYNFDINKNEFLKVPRCRACSNSYLETKTWADDYSYKK